MKVDALKIVSTAGMAAVFVLLIVGIINSIAHYNRIHDLEIEKIKLEIEIKKKDLEHINEFRYYYAPRD